MKLDTVAEILRGLVANPLGQKPWLHSLNPASVDDFAILGGVQPVTKGPGNQNRI